MIAVAATAGSPGDLRCRLEVLLTKSIMCVIKPRIEIMVEFDSIAFLKIWTAICLGIPSVAFLVLLVILCVIDGPTLFFTKILAMFK